MIKLLNYKGKEIPIRISYYALKMLKEKLGKSLQDIANDDFEAFEILIFYSIESGYRFLDQKFPYEFEKDAVNLTDVLFFEFLKIIPEFFPDTEFQQPLTKKEVEKK